MSAGRRLPLLCAALLWPGAPCPGAPVDGERWIAEDGAALELLLAHQENTGPDVGVLRIDPIQRTLVWEGMGPQACQHRIDAGFEDVRSVRTRRAGGFVLELRSEPARTLVLIPLPHAAWLATQHPVEPGRLDSLLESSDVFAGRGASRSAGSMGASSGISFRTKDPTADVVADTGKAVDRILDVLGRPPAPLVVLREALYGRPTDVSVAELLEEPARYDGRSIRLRGRVELSPGGQRLVDEDSAVTIAPEPDIAALVQVDAPRWSGQELEVAGVLQRRGEESVVSFWEYAGPEQSAGLAAGGRGITLQALAATPGQVDGAIVRVIGKFRGRNLYGDLPTRSRRRDTDWVIKDDRWAVWVTGHEPAGDGWALDARATDETGQWLEVVGRPTTRGGMTSLTALEVRPVPAPQGARVVPSRQLVLPKDAEPCVIFQLPLEGEPISRDGRFVLQFSKYMDEESFKGRVRLRYAEGDGQEMAVRISYDETRRALVVEPQEPLQPGRTVEIQLLPGILDVKGLPLRPRGAVDAAGAVDRIRYLVGS